MGDNPRFESVSDMVRATSEDESFVKDVDRRISERQLTKHLIAHRVRNNMSQRQIADQLGCSQSRISKLENSRDDDIRLGDLEQYAKAIALELRLVISPANRTLVDEIRYHAFRIKDLLTRLVELAEEDDQIADGVGKFACIETPLNLLKIVVDTAKRIPQQVLKRLRFLVVEDEWPARNYLVELMESSSLAEVVGAVASVAEAREALAAAAGPTVDVAFCDLQLSGNKRAGLELVRSLSASRPGLMLVLATAFEEHAMEAFELGVVDYLLKPFSEERVVQCLKRLQSRRPAPAAPSGPSRIVARRKKNFVFLEPKEIWAFEAADRLTFVHTQHGRFDLDLSLAAIEVSLGRTLTRVHRNWLVNAAFIKELERDGHETSLFVGPSLGAEGQGLHVPVSRDRSQAVKDMLLADTTGLRRP